MFHRSRLTAVLMTGVLAVGAAVGTTGSATAAERPKTARADRADRAGDWLQSQLTKGVIFNNQYKFHDLGLTVDTGSALLAIGGHRKAVKKIQRKLAEFANEYVRFDSEDIYAGSAAKLAVFAKAVGAKPKKFGGLNLISLLDSTVSTEPGIVGRVQDKTEFDDYANVISQAYAVGALSTARSSKAASATKFLLKQQCKPGYFRTYFADAAASDQTCDGAATAAERTPDTDATAIAVLNLQSIKHPNRKVKKAIAKALRWLHRTQKSNGSFGGGATTKASNSNSTGLAAWALGDGGRCADAKRAARWVAKLQRKNGAIAYDRAALKEPISKATQDQWRRATAQAGPGLRYLKGC